MPAQIGRFRICRPLGSGGMSVVYEAYDDRLDRTVALKLLRERGGRRRQARLQREAQALARLSHPNVVEVYETGMHGGRAFLVMERLPGEPLQRWIAASPRSVSEVITTFIAAGRGLAAAHGQGLVHRDFKPSNVLVGEDGRVRVFDFGLAAPFGLVSEDSVGTGPYAMASGPHSVGTGPHSVASGPHPVIAEALADLEGPVSYDEIWESALTRTGAMLGTPAYMSPEQYEGRPATAQSDQFAFCVALFEALHGEHPFVEREQWDLLPKHVMEGKLREPPRGRGVPAAVQRVLVRGLSTRSKGRWPSMDALLIALERALGQRRWVAWVTGAALLSASAAGLVLWLGRPPAQTSECTGASDKLAEVWGPQQRARVHDAMTGIALPEETDYWHEVETGLDAYAAAWSDGHRRMCEEASRADDDVEMDGRVACLERRRRALGSLVEVLATADAAVVRESIGALHQLESIDACDQQGGRGLKSAPSDPELAEDIETHRGELARARSLERSGKYRESLEVAAVVAHDADALGYAPLQAEAQLQVGRSQRYLGLHGEAERALERAYFLGQEIEHDELAREAVTMLAYVVARLQLRPEEGLRWLEHARVAAERVGGDRAWAEYLDTEGSVLLAARRRDDALQRYQQALPLFERELGPEHPRVAGVLNNIGLLLLELERPDVALDYIRRSLSIREAVLGPDHPEVGKMLNNLGLALSQAGRDDEAIASFQRAHALRRRVLGPDHPDVAKPLANLAQVQLRQGQLDEAAEHAAQALAIRERAHGVDSVEAAMMHVLVGRVWLARGGDAEAAQRLERAVVAIEQALGAERVELVEPLVHLAAAELRVGRTDEALAHVQRALSIGGTQKLEPWEMADGRFVLSRVDAALGEPALAGVEAAAAARGFASMPESRRRMMAATIAELDAWNTRWVESGD